MMFLNILLILSCVSVVCDAVKLFGVFQLFFSMGKQVVLLYVFVFVCLFV